MGDAGNFLALHLMMALPGGWRGGIWHKIELWLLPYAGAWAYRDMRPSSAEQTANSAPGMNTNISETGR